MKWVVNVGGIFIKRLLVFIMISAVFVTSACTSGKTKTLEMFYTEAEVEQVDEVLIQNGVDTTSKTITLFDIENEKEFEFLLNKIGDTYYETNSNILRIVDQYYLNFDGK